MLSVKRSARALGLCVGVLVFSGLARPCVTPPAQPPSVKVVFTGLDKIQVVFEGYTTVVLSPGQFCGGAINDAGLPAGSVVDAFRIVDANGAPLGGLAFAANQTPADAFFGAGNGSGFVSAVGQAVPAGISVALVFDVTVPLGTTFGAVRSALTGVPLLVGADETDMAGNPLGTLQSILPAGVVCERPFCDPTRPFQRIDTGLPGTGNTNEGISVAWNAGIFAVVWAETNGVGTSNQDIYCSVSTDEGLTFGPPVRVDNGDALNLTNSELPRVAIADDGTIGVLWEEWRGCVEEVYWNRSTDGGATFGATPLPLDNLNCDTDEHTLASFGNGFYVTYELNSGPGGQEPLFFVKSNDSGATFTAPADIHFLFSGGGPAFACVDSPSVYAGPAGILVPFNDDRTGSDDQYLLRSFDDGATFSEVLLDDVDQQGDVDRSKVGADGNLVAVIWAEDVVGPNGDETRIAVSTDGATTFGSEMSVTPAAAATLGASVLWADVAVNGTDIYVVYASDHASVAAGGSSGQSGSDVYVSYSNDSGVTWSFDNLIDCDPRRSNRPALVATDFGAYVHLESGVNGANGLAYAFTLDRGATWTVADVPGLAGSDVDSSEPEGSSPWQNTFFAYDPVSNAAVSAWHWNQTGVNEVYASGIRLPCLLLNGTPQIGSNTTFEIRNAPSDAASFLVAVSVTGTGPTSLGGGLPLLHLDVDAVTLLVLNDPLLAPFFSGSITGGDGAAASLPYPLGPGATFFAATAALNAQGAIAYLTDPLTVVSQ